MKSINQQNGARHKLPAKIVFEVMGSILLLITTSAHGQIWEPLPAKIAVLVVSAHPDDEAIFFGGVLPYYSRIRNLPTVLIALTSGQYLPENGPPHWRREEELCNACWRYGLRYKPIFPRFMDVWTDGAFGTDPSDANQTWPWWDDRDDRNRIPGTIADGRVATSLYLAQQIRDLKPEVIATHDFKGEYGHGNHKATALAVAAAWDLAAGRAVTIDNTHITPGSLSGAVWEAKKVYMHLYYTGHSDLFHTGWEEPRAELGNRTVRDIADEGLAEHASQGSHQRVETIYDDGEGDEYFGENMCNSEEWGLYATTVGPDTETAIPVDLELDPEDANYINETDAQRHFGDFLENIDLTAYANELTDVDGDGIADEDDLSAIQNALGQTVSIGSVAKGDANGNGLVDTGDLHLFYVACPNMREGPSIEHFSYEMATGIAEVAVIGPCNRYYEIYESDDLVLSRWDHISPSSTSAGIIHHNGVMTDGFGKADLVLNLGPSIMKQYVRFGVP